MGSEQLTNMMEPPPIGAFPAHQRAPSRQLHLNHILAAVNAQPDLQLSSDKRKRF